MQNQNTTTLDIALIPTLQSAPHSHMIQHWRCWPSAYERLTYLSTP